MPEKRNSIFFFLEYFFFADRPTRFFDGPATRNKLFPKVALRGKDAHIKGYFKASSKSQNITLLVKFWYYIPPFTCAPLRGIKCQKLGLLDIFSKAGHQQFITFCMMVEGNGAHHFSIVFHIWGKS